MEFIVHLQDFHCGIYCSFTKLPLWNLLFIFIHFTLMFTDLISTLMLLWTHVLSPFPTQPNRKEQEVDYSITYKEWLPITAVQQATELKSDDTKLTIWHWQLFALLPKLASVADDVISTSAGVELGIRLVALPFECPKLEEPCSSHLIVDQVT